jgi:hypothetical protein
LEGFLGSAAVEKRLVLHVGPHKTGSTYLQHQLVQSREALRRYGWEYPEFGQRLFAQHNIYSWLANERNGGDVTEQGLLALLANHPRLIISSEDFSYLSRDGLTRLATLVSDRPIEVVYFLRSTTDVWPSHWQELVRHGRDETFLEYLAAFAGWVRALHVNGMNPMSQLNRFANALGKNAIKIICYDNIVDKKDDIFHYFCENILGLDANQLPASRRVIHPSQPIDMIEMLRGLNERYKEIYKKSPDDRILGAYQKIQNEIESTPEYADFKTSFNAYSQEVILSNEQGLIRQIEGTIVNVFGDRFQNRATEKSIFYKEMRERRVRYAPRYWVDKCGLRGFVDKVLEDINLGFLE